MKTYSFIVNDTAAGSGHFVFNGMTEPSGQYFLVPAAQLSQVSFVAGAPGSIDSLAVNVFDGTDWGTGAPLNVIVGSAQALVVSAAQTTAPQAHLSSVRPLLP